MTELSYEQLVSIEVRQEKYCRNNETTKEEIFDRVSKHIASVEKNEQDKIYWQREFRDNFDIGAIGGGRIMATAGSDVGASLINCFVQPIADSIALPDENGYPGIYMALKDAAETMRRGGGVGYDFSLIRPKFSQVKGTSSFASGPCSYINVFDKSCETVESAGSRRGAQLAALKVTHPDIEEYIVAKREEKRWNNFNVSVMVSDKFMEAVKNNEKWELVHKAEPSDYLKEKSNCYKREDGLWVYKVVQAADLWQTIMKSNYDFAEPGILFYDNINGDNNLRYVETIDATNPCGEQPLPPYGCCDLGPIILTNFVSNPFTNNAAINYILLQKSVSTHVRFLDNVLDATYWPLQEQKEEAMSKRRIGLGFTGLGNALSMLGLPYNTKEARETASNIAEIMRNTAYATSIELAKEKGSFPLFDAEKYLEEGTFASRLPDHLKDKIRKYGIRNSHLLSIAPTGTVSLAFADNASNGIEPPYSLAYTRKKRLDIGGHKEYIVLDHSLREYLKFLPDKDRVKLMLQALVTGKKEFVYNNNVYKIKDQLPASIVTALEISAEDHLLMMKAVQPYIDSAISKTINVPANYPFEDFKQIYEKAHEYKLKGVATYRPNSVLGSVLSEIKQDDKTEEVKKYDPAKDYNNFMETEYDKRPIGRLTGCSDQYTYYNSEGEIKFYVGVSFIQKQININDNTSMLVKRPIEIFINSEMNVGNEWSKLLGITMSQWARNGINKLAKFLKTCQKMKSDRGSIRFGFILKPDGSKAARFHGSDIGVMAFAIQDLLFTEGILDKHGNPVKYEDLFINDNESNVSDSSDITTEEVQATGSICTECGAPSVIKKDGCKFCTNCGAEGSCG